MNENNDIREKLISAAEQLIRSGRKTESLTSREIARAAGTSAGLVNYHFGSKDDLVEQAVGRIFAEFAPEWERVIQAAGETGAASGKGKKEAEKGSLRAGKEELKTLLKKIARAVEEMSGGSEFMIRRELLEGNLDTTKFLVPVLRSILPRETDEKELRWAAFFIVAPMQLLFLRREWFSDWTGTHVNDGEERDTVMDFLVDRILDPFGK